jgi:hypothetical protein
VTIEKTVVNVPTRKLSVNWSMEDSPDLEVFMSSEAAQSLHAAIKFNEECDLLEKDGWIIFNTLDEVPESWIQEHVTGTVRWYGTKFAFQDAVDATFFAISWKVF